MLNVVLLLLQLKRETISVLTETFLKKLIEIEQVGKVTLPGMTLCLCMFGIGGESCGVQK